MNVALTAGADGAQSSGPTPKTESPPVLAIVTFSELNGRSGTFVKLSTIAPLEPTVVTPSSSSETGGGKTIESPGSPPVRRAKSLPRRGVSI